MMLAQEKRPIGKYTPNFKWSEAKVDNVERLCKNGLTIEWIAARFGTTTDVIAELMAIRGVDYRRARP